MTVSLPSERDAHQPPAFPEVEFGRSADGFAVARVVNSALATLPGRDGGHYLAYGWKIGRPIAEWRRADFYGHSGDLADENAFRAKVAESAEHQRERKALGRVEDYSRAHTPWGASQSATVYADGVVSRSTAGHGGFKLSAERNRHVHPMLRSRGGWYEEDAEWAIVALTFPHLFTGYERRCAERTIKDSWPDAWEAIFGTILQPGESYEKDRRAFENLHAKDWIVISAITSDSKKGFVECVATLGGKRGATVAQQRFLVLSDEYKMGRFGFVIDPTRHAVDAIPSGGRS